MYNYSLELVSLHLNARCISIVSKGTKTELCVIQIVVFQSLVARELKETLNKISPLNCFLRFL